MCLLASEDTRLLKRLLILAVCFFIALMIAGAVGLYVSGFFGQMSREGLLAQSAVQNILGFIGASGVYAWMISKRPLSFLGLTEKVGWRPFVGVIIVYAVSIPFLNQLIYYNEQMTFPASLSGLESYMRNLEEAAAELTKVILSSASVGGLISGVLIVGILTGFSEELLFRGALQRTLTSYPPLRQCGIWIAAAIFSAVHMQFFGFFPRLLLGAFFGYLLYSTGSLWPGAFAHAVNNSLVIVTAWIAAKTSDGGSSPDEWGVATSGFPWIAAVSLLLTIGFFKFFYNYFFNGKEREYCEKS